MGDGLKCLNIATDEIKEYRNNPNQANSLYNDYIAQLTLSPDGHRLYVGTSVGLSCLDINSGSWLKTFGTNKIISGIPYVLFAKTTTGYGYARHRDYTASTLITESRKYTPQHKD